MALFRVFNAGLGATAVAIALGLPAHAQVRIEGIDDPALLSLARSVLPAADRPENRIEARRLATDAARRLDALMRSQGYYAASVEPVAVSDDDFEAVVMVQPGHRFTVGEMAYTVQGEEQAHAAALPAAEDEPAIEIGDPLVADDVLAEEAAAVTRLRFSAYPDATPRPRDIIVDHATGEASVTYNIDAGRRAQFGMVTLQADTPVRERWFGRLIPFEAGDPYTPEQMERLSRRLSGTGAYDAVTVRLAPSEPGEGVEQREVNVHITEGDRHSIELGGGYGTTEGVRLEAEWARRNMFGGAETLSAALVAATLEQSLRTELRAPHFLRPNRTARLGLLAIQEEKDAYDRTAGVLTAVAEQPLSPRLNLAVGLSVEQSQVKDVFEGQPRKRDFSLVSGFGEVRYDGTDDLLNPSRGFRGGIRLEPGVAFGSDDLTFIRAIFDASAYQQVMSRLILAGRVRVGTIYGAEAEDLPADRRFYAGGGGSVRGYAYQSLGPRVMPLDPEDDPLPIGGRSLLELSAEARVRVTETWGGVAFVDAGTTRRGQIPDPTDLSAGVGVGVRYYTAFGPIRADVAVPLNKREGDRGYQFYLSIGQAF